jgi:probable rRNA maturation factor
VRRVLREERRDLALSLAFVDRRRIREVNRRFLGRRGVTDVIAFPAESGVGQPIAEVVICAELAVSEARKRGHAASAELALYVVHGVLHVLGYDDTTRSATARMRKREAEVLTALGYGQVAV